MGRKYVGLSEGYGARLGGRWDEVQGYVVGEIGVGEGYGERGYVHACYGELGERGREVGVQKEGYTACSCAEVYDFQGLSLRAKVPGSEEVREVGGVGLWLGSAEVFSER